jgi:helicase SWR1
MPPRFAYWTILAGGLPTAFRATEREELLPTFKRIQEKHPDAQMKYFARGKLWESREAAQARPPERAPHERRGRDWRPGGDHRDPRQKFADAQKEKNQERRKDRFERKKAGPPREKPHGDPLRPKTSRPSGPPKDAWRNRPQGARPPGRPSGRPSGRPPGRPPGRPSGRPPGDRRRRS